MPDATIYYKSTHPEVLAYKQETERLYGIWQQKVKAVEAEFPGYRAVFTRCGGTRWLSGLSGETVPGEGWKKRGNFWCPDHQTSAGRKHYRRLKAVKFSSLAVPGMPPSVWRENTVESPGVHHCGEEVWVYWSCTPDELEKDPRFNPALWQRAKASEYHLAVEAEEAS